MIKVRIKDKKTKRYSYIYFSSMEQVKQFYKTQYPNFPMDISDDLLLNVGHIFCYCECTATRANP
jgi:hypothetical protein